MSNRLFNVFIFAAGSATGSLITWKALKDHYETKTRNDVESVKRRYESQNDIPKEESPEKENNVTPFTRPEKPNLKEYVEKLSENGYVDYTQPKTIEKEEEVSNFPVVIPPNEFGEEDGYEQISLTLFSDKVLVDDAYEIISDVESIVGHDSLERFGEYEDDCVYVRNDILKNYYEILRDERTYADLLDDRPHLDKEF